MSFDVLNPLMLLGLAGVALPVLAHLLSRKKYDIVQWGAMQFLELGRDARRKIRLEEILLMLVRMGLIALIAVALSRPWASGGFLTNLVSTQPRDVVIVIDGSYSMGWGGRAVTPHAAAIQWAHDFLEDLRPGDTIALLDARDHVRPVIESPTRDFKFVREQLTALPPPSGSSNLAEATSRAVQILSRTSNLARDVVVLTDGQARGWRADDENLWTRIDDLRTQPAVQPRVWVVDVEGKNSPARTNFSVERVQLSRELTVPDFPIRIQTKIRAHGGSEPVSRGVYLEADGQRLSEKTLQVQLAPDGEASVEFEHRFTTPGSHVLTVALDEDNLPGDNRSDAAVNVAEALPVLLVDGTPNLDRTRTETFFAVAALTASSNETPWVRAKVVPFDRLDPNEFNSAEVVVLANVPKLSEAQVDALKAYVAGGGGLFVATGDRVDADAWNGALFEEGAGLLPASLVKTKTDTTPELKGVRVVDESLEVPWMMAFRARHGGGFTEARFTQWWKLAPAVTAKEAEDAAADESRPPLRGGKTLPPRSGGLLSTTPVVAARLNTGDPLLLTRRYGRGSVAQLAAPLDADWSTLPAKSDFVPLLHEILFHLASGRTSRNVDVGLPLVQAVPADFAARRHAFFGPGETEFAVTPAGDEVRPLVRLDDTKLPGVYTLQSKSDPPAVGDLSRPEYFVVNADRGESDLTPLDDIQRNSLTRDDRLAFIATHAELQKQLLTDTSRAEFWHLLLLLFLAILVAEVVMTRRLVQGGHEAVDPEEAEEFVTTDAHR